MTRRPEVSGSPPASGDGDSAPADEASATAGGEGATAAPSPDAATRRGGWLIARVPFLVALALGLYYLLESYALGLGSLAEPQSGLWPFAVSIVLIVCSLLGMVAASHTDVDRFGRQGLRPLLGLIALGVFVVLFDVVGLILTGIVVLLFWFRFLARESWLLAAALAVGATVVAHVLFVVLLGARLPDDVVAQLWGGR